MNSLSSPAALQPIALLPQSRTIVDWLENSPSFLIRLLADYEARQAAEPRLILEALRSGSLRLTSADTDTHCGDALLALLSVGDGALRRGARHNGAAINHRCLTSEETDLALHLAAHGCDPHRIGEHGGSAMGQALFNMEIRLLDAWLDAADWTAWRVDQGHGSQPVAHLAAASGNTEMLEVLSRHGLEVNQRNAEGRTPLFFAGTAAAVTWLLAHGADRSLVDRAGVDALAFWHGHRKLAGEPLDAMRKALGKLDRAATATPQGIASFFESAKSLASGRLMAEAKRLAITGSETHEGLGIVRLAAQRLQKSGRFGVSSNNANAWIDKVMDWPQAVAAATDADLAFLWLTELFHNQGGKHSKGQSALLTRHPASSAAFRAAVLEAAPAFTAEPGHSDALVSILCALKDGPLSPTAAPVLSRTLMGFLANGVLGPHPDTYRLRETTHAVLRQSVLKAVPTASWSTPGLLTALLAATPLPARLNTGVEIPQSVPEEVATAIEHGATWQEADEAALSAFEKHSVDNGIKGLGRRLALVRASALRAELEAGTTPAAPERPLQRSMRL